MKRVQSCVLGLISTLGLPALADVKLPAVFSDNMVLQKSDKAPFFGTADNGETVTVKVGAAAGQATAGDDGKWKLEMSVNGVKNVAEEKASANFSEIRMFTVKKATSDTPLTVGGFSAVGYFFARELNQKLGVSIGVIHTSWGATVAEAWTSKEALAGAEPDVKVIWN